jgi:heterodisulfide reductase subunit B
VAPYYGCLIVRPGYGGLFDDPEHPTKFDKLMRALGAEVVDFPLKAQCCGGHMTQISEEVAYEMIRRLLQNAADYETDVIATICPMCQLNLDAYQINVSQFFKTNFSIPALYFTQLIGLAFGVSAVRLGIGTEFVDAQPALSKVGVTVPLVEAPARRPSAAKEALPMPQMQEEER